MLKTSSGIQGVVGIVIPSYRAARSISQVIATIPDFVDHIIVVDDSCPENSGKIAEKLNNPRVTVLCHHENQGVGGATMTGFRRALEYDCDVIVKLDSDGQMNPAYIKPLVIPLLKNKADYIKGNRFRNFNKLKKMPMTRLIGNSILSFIVKGVSGYWNIIDPTNGYVAIHRRVLEKLNTAKMAKSYFFETDMLINLNIIGAVVADMDMPAQYSNEESSMVIKKIVIEFPFKLARGFALRIFYRYFLYNFDMASIYILIGLPTFSFGVIFGMYHWMDSIFTGVPKTAGTIMLAALPIIVSFQMLLQAVHIDINSVPKK